MFDRSKWELDITKEDLKKLKSGVCDYLSFSYYCSRTVSYNLQETGNGNVNKTVVNPHLKTSEWGWGFDPLGLRITLNDIYDRYGKMIFIAENGLGAIDSLIEGKVHDDYRIQYLEQHIIEMKKAIEEDGIPVFGYTVWSAFDLVSGSSGEMKKRYGLVYVDADDYGNGTYQRYKKDSFYWYKKVIASNGSDLN